MKTKKNIPDKLVNHTMGKEDKPKYIPQERYYVLSEATDCSSGENCSGKEKYSLGNSGKNDYSLDYKGRNPMFDYPRITLARTIHEVLGVRTLGDLTTLYIDGISVVSYSPTAREHFGRKISLDKEDLAGELFFNTEFFKKFDLNRALEASSEMENIAKTFFKVNGDNYVALVQYLREGGRSAEHYHTLEESIVQLAGRSYVELRPVGDDTDYRIVELEQGDIIRIPSNNIHFVEAIEGGSLTIPIKQTLGSRKDHLYTGKSDKRISQEVDRLLREAYSSGDEAVSALHNYYENLRTSTEKITAMNLLTKRSSKDDNPNIRKILREFIADYL